MLRLLPILLCLGGSLPSVQAEELPAPVAELLDFYCYDCHGYGKSEGGVELDEIDFSKGFQAHGDLWERVWRNVRSGVMPPSDVDQLAPGERAELLTWLEEKPLGIDRRNPDPGRVTIRRHNREEYQNTIYDLTGLTFNSAESFPPDDSGHGFDTIGDVLTISPLLAERYLEAAQAIMAKAVPDNAGREPATEIWAPGFVNPDQPTVTGREMTFAKSQTVEARRWLGASGPYQLALDLRVQGAGKKTDETATLVLKVNGEELAREELSHDSLGKIRLESPAELGSQQHAFTLEMQTGKAAGQNPSSLWVKVEKLRITGPLGKGNSVYPGTYRQIISKENQPTTREDWSRASEEVLRDFASKAWRRPVSDDQLARLGELADEAAQREDSFEAGIRQAGTAILASPRFILRSEQSLAPDLGKTFPQIDEWSLASRLSYFLWSSLPDAELRGQAAEGTLRQNLDAQIERMLDDEKAKRFTQNFVGQWLQARDVETVGMRPESVLGISFAAGSKTFTTALRRDMRRETEALFEYILLNDRPATELVAADYTFLNQRLADFYQIPGDHGEDLRKVSGHRGGILTQGTFLIVTSNPTRTSPVKRGLFVLENLLGTPPPPAPPDIPALEEATEGLGQLTMKEQMVEHRKNPDCRSCHARMDPIGLAFENFTAVGTFRETDGGKAIESDGKLITGEEFAGVEELKKILTTDRRTDFERCLTEKLLTYALGRGVEYYDAPTIDQIVKRMEMNEGSLKEAVKGVIHSAPFQKRRVESAF